jgi:hypothetical protein
MSGSSVFNRLIERSLNMVHRAVRSFIPPLVLVAAVTFVLAAFLYAPSGVATQPTAHAAAATPPVIDVMASDYAFQAPDVLPSGLVTVRLMNHGQEPHHAQLLRLNDGVSFDQFAAALQAEGEGALRMTTITGGPGAVDPLKSSEVTLDLSPGSYALACFITSPDGVPHLAKGMLKPLTVADEAADPSTAPEAAGTMTLRDFAFDLPDQVPAGRLTYKVVNDGPQPHELNILKLTPGSTVDDVRAWAANPSTPPPFEAVGGMNGLGPGEDGFMTVDLEPGAYVAICNIPDPASGWSHSRLGMIRAFTVV